MIHTSAILESNNILEYCSRTFVLGKMVSAVINKSGAWGHHFDFAVVRLQQAGFGGLDVAHFVI